jgi:hypothetical protein
MVWDPRLATICSSDIRPNKRATWNWKLAKSTAKKSFVVLPNGFVTIAAKLIEFRHIAYSQTPSACLNDTGSLEPLNKPANVLSGYAKQCPHLLVGQGNVLAANSIYGVTKKIGRAFFHRMGDVACDTLAELGYQAVRITGKQPRKCRQLCLKPVHRVDVRS